MSPQGNHLERKARSIKDASKNSNRIPHVCGRESLKMPVADRPPNVCEGHVRQLLFDVNPFRDQAILWFLCVLFELFSKFSTSACARAHTHTHKCTHTRDVRSSERARAHIHTHMHARTHAHAHTHTHTHVHTHTNKQTHTHTYTRIHTHTHTHTHTHSHNLATPRQLPFSVRGMTIVTLCVGTVELLQCRTKPQTTRWP